MHFWVIYIYTDFHLQSTVGVYIASTYPMNQNQLFSHQVWTTCSAHRRLKKWKSWRNVGSCILAAVKWWLQWASCKLSTSYLLPWLVLKMKIMSYHVLASIRKCSWINNMHSKRTGPTSREHRKFGATCVKERPHAPQPVELSQSHQCRERFEQRGTQAEHHEVDRTQGVTCWRTNYTSVTYYSNGPWTQFLLYFYWKMMGFHCYFSLPAGI